MENIIIHKVWIKGYWNFEGMFPRYIGGHYRGIIIPIEKIKLRKRLLQNLQLR